MKIKIATSPTGKKAKLAFKEPKAEDMALSKRLPDTLKPSSMTEAVSLMKRLLRRDIPVLILGSSGFGKSELTRQAGGVKRSKKDVDDAVDKLVNESVMNIPGFPVAEVLDIRAGQMNVEDLRGLPMLIENSEDIDQTFTKTTIPSWLQKVIRNRDKNYILFFDELNHASASVLNAVYGIVLERTLDDYDFSERTRIVAAGNKSDQNEDLTELSDPLMRRFEIIDIDQAIDMEITQRGNFYESYLMNKYKGRIPEEILEEVFALGIETSDPRSVERTLKAWVEDIADGEEFLTVTGSIPSGLQQKIQKIYTSKFYKPTAALGHKTLIDQVAEEVKKLRETNPEYFVSQAKMYVLKDLLKGNIKGKVVEDITSAIRINEKGKKVIQNKFKDVEPELIEAALSE